ncbi:type II toxin-antitoxin system VapC family toxin [Parapedobacter sp. DT-150]|uniref:type II toxin-antitoxin system VapC family toxin n=1 Tax=Parapedobacter sp. DT-150 TaxID=3396162 RepID=UPI003F19B967
MAGEALVLCDTNILIELSKNNSIIVEKLSKIGANKIVVSAISAGEFLFGARDRHELAKIKRSLNSIKIMHADNEISEFAIRLIEKYTLSHHLDVPDAFIAATAIIKGANLYTLNLKHFKYIEGLKLHI